MDTSRPATADDAVACGHICYDAFCAINDAHQFPHDFPSTEFTTELLGMLIDHPGLYGVVPERDGRIVGSNFLDERATVVGVGPISVDPAVQNQCVGRRLMQAVIDRAPRVACPVCDCANPPSIVDHCASTRPWTSANASYCHA